VSSPVSDSARNSSLAEPPIAPDIAETITYRSASRSKIFTYAARCFAYDSTRPSSVRSNE
jgi:hypothetical protein